MNGSNLDKTLFKSVYMHIYITSNALKTNMIYLGKIKITFSKNVLMTSHEGGSSFINLHPVVFSLLHALPCVCIFCWPSVNLYVIVQKNYVSIKLLSTKCGEEL